MWHGVGPVGRIQEQHSRLTVMMRLVDDLLEKVACPNRFISTERYASGFSLLRRTTETTVFRRHDIRETQFPIGIIFDRLHESVGNTHRDIKIGDLVFINLASDEFVNIRMVHAQDTHVGSAPCATLGDFTKGMIVNPQEAHRTGGLPGRRFDQ